LSLRPHSAKEIEKKLRDKGFSAETVKEALEKLRELQYLHDASFAVQWARNLAVNKFWSNRKIIADLQTKGVEPQLIDEAVASARAEFAEKEAVEVLIRKKTAGKKMAGLDIKEKHKIYQSLLRRGFPPGLILNKLGKVEEEFNGEDG